MDDELRNRLWSALKLTVLDRWSAPYEYAYQDPDSQDVDVLFRLIWLNHFKKPIDTLPHDHNERYSAVRDYFFRCEWWQAYDLIEFIIKNLPEKWAEPLTNFINSFFEEENADCRIVGNEIIPITDVKEIESD